MAIKIKKVLQPVWRDMKKSLRVDELTEFLHFRGKLTQEEKSRILKMNQANSTDAFHDLKQVLITKNESVLSIVELYLKERQHAHILQTFQSSWKKEQNKKAISWGDMTSAVQLGSVIGKV